VSGVLFHRTTECAVKPELWGFRTKPPVPPTRSAGMIGARVAGPLSTTTVCPPPAPPAAIAVTSVKPAGTVVWPWELYAHATTTPGAGIAIVRVSEAEPA